MQTCRDAFVQEVACEKGVGDSVAEFGGVSPNLQQSGGVSPASLTSCARLDEARSGGVVQNKLHAQQTPPSSLLLILR